MFVQVLTVVYKRHAKGSKNHRFSSLLVARYPLVLPGSQFCMPTCTNIRLELYKHDVESEVQRQGGVIWKDFALPRSS